MVVSAHTPELFAYVREVSNAYWRTQSAGPPQSIWDRDDLVPIGHLDWGEEHWTCLSRVFGLQQHLVVFIDQYCAKGVVAVSARLPRQFDGGAQVGD